MNKITLTILILFLISKGYSNIFNTNSIGVVYLKSTTNESYELTIIFPMSSIKYHDNYDTRLDNSIVDTLEFHDDILIFDNKGIIGTIKNTEKVFVHFWCENDSGIQFRPEINITINRNEIKGELKSNPELQKLTCFSIINYDRNNLKRVEPETRYKLEIEGDVNGDGINECEVYSFPDDAENCDGLPDNNLVLLQKIGDKRNRLRCCGP